MDKQIKTSEQIQAEIERLKSSPYVKLAKKAENDIRRCSLQNDGHYLEQRFSQGC